MGDVNTYRPLIEDAASRYGLDPDLVAAIVLTESAADPAAVRYEPHVGKYVQDPEKHRPRGCSVETETRLQMMSFSMMQVMGFNIRAMGYTGWLTEYLDPAKGLEIGCRFLADLLKRWKSVEDAVSAYNQGSPRRGEDGRYRNQEYVDRVIGLYRQFSKGGPKPIPAKPAMVDSPAGEPKYRFSEKSLAKLRTADDRLQLVMNASIADPECPEDIIILEGHRGQVAQDDAFRRGASKVKWPNGEHNKIPSKAVDAAPYPIDWKDIGRFKRLAEHIKKVAARLGIEIEWGGDWPNFKDYPHWQVR